MENGPSFNHFSDENRQFLDGLDTEFSQEWRTFTNQQLVVALNIHSAAARMFMSEPSNKKLADELSRSHIDAVLAFKGNIDAMRNGGVEKETQIDAVHGAFIMKDACIAEINRAVYGKESAYDALDLYSDLEALFDLDDEEVEEQLIDKFSRDYSDTMQAFIRLHGDADFWTKERLEMKSNLYEEIEYENDSAIIELTDEVFAAHDDLVGIIKIMSETELDPEQLDTLKVQAMDYHDGLKNDFEQWLTHVIVEVDDPEEQKGLAGGMMTILNNKQYKLYAYITGGDASSYGLAYMKAKTAQAYKTGDKNDFLIDMITMFNEKFTEDVTRVLDAIN